MFQGNSTMQVLIAQIHAILWKIVFSKFIFGFTLPVQKTDIRCYSKFSFVV